MKSPIALLLTLLALLSVSLAQATSPVFVGNTAVMYEKVCQASPFFVRSLTRNAILKEIQRQGHQEVTETAFYQVIQAVTPKKFLDKTIAILDRHKTSDNNN